MTKLTYEERKDCPKGVCLSEDAALPIEMLRTREMRWQVQRKAGTHSVVAASSEVSEIDVENEKWTSAGGHYARFEGHSMAPQLG